MPHENFYALLGERYPSICTKWWPFTEPVSPQSETLQHDIFNKTQCMATSKEPLKCKLGIDGEVIEEQTKF